MAPARLPNGASGQGVGQRRTPPAPDNGRDRARSPACRLRRRRHRWPLSSYFLLAALGLFLLATVGPLIGVIAYVPVSRVFSPAAVAVLSQAMTLSISSSLVATLLATLLGVPTALCLARVDFPGRRVASALIELPIALPPLVLGVGLLLTLGRNGICGRFLYERGIPLSFTPLAVVIAQFVVAAPFLVKVARAAIEQVPRSLEEASFTLGRRPLATYLRVTLPIAWPGVLSGIVTCWARAMSEFGATALFAGNFPGRTQTMPLAIFSSMQYDLETAVAVSIVMLGFSGLAFLLAQVGLRQV